MCDDCEEFKRELNDRFEKIENRLDDLEEDVSAFEDNRPSHSTDNFDDYDED